MPNVKGPVVQVPRKIVLIFRLSRTAATRKGDVSQVKAFVISTSKMMPQLDRGCFGILTAAFFLCSKKSKTIENDALNKAIESMLQKTRSNRGRLHEVKVLVNVVLDEALTDKTEQPRQPLLLHICLEQIDCAC